MGTMEIIASDRNWIDARSVESLKKIATYRGVRRVAGLPDLSVGEVPNGMAVMTGEYIYPHLIGGDIGCGMSLFAVALKSKKIKAEKFAKQLANVGSLDEIKIAQPLGCYHLGSIGRGNHFAELQLVASVEDESAFERLGLHRQWLYLLVHSGSRAYGQTLFEKVAGSYDPTLGLEAESKAAQAYLAAHDKAIMYARQSRAEIAARLLKALKIDMDMIAVSDTAHNSITATPEGWLHRKGAAPADCGAVVIAGSRGSLSYLVLPAKETGRSIHSLAHGAGRKWERNSAQAKLQNRYTKADLLRTQIGSRVVCRDSKLLYEEAPQAYKNIDVVIDDLVEAGLVTVVARLRPILTYKE